MNDSQLLVKQLADVLKQHVAESIEPFVRQVQELKLEIEQLKKLPQPQNGKDGRDGVDGKSLTPDDLRPILEELVKTIPVQNGKDGRDGIDGSDGKDGRDGIDGSDGKDGRDGRDGKDGRDGVDGKDGAKGADGRDALEIDILPDIDFDKSYAAGQYAYHRGGLWKSSSRTHGQKGWDCVVEGLCSIDVNYDGERGFGMEIEKSSGQILKKSFKLPLVIEKGVFRPEVNYEKGDGVTYGGSFWIAQKDKPEGTPGSNNDWRLTVKRGRDYKEPTKIGK